MKVAGVPVTGGGGVSRLRRMLSGSVLNSPGYSGTQSRLCGAQGRDVDGSHEKGTMAWGLNQSPVRLLTEESDNLRFGPTIRDSIEWSATGMAGTLISGRLLMRREYSRKDPANEDTHRRYPNSR